MHKSKQIRVSVWQRSWLIILGLFLSFVILEIGLQAGGFVMISLLEYKNRVSLKQRSAYRIMCIGESTTQGQYPKFLEEILNQRNTGIRFSVIDKGVTAASTALLLSQLEANLNAYKPDMVVAMMGINDAEKFYFADGAVNRPPVSSFFRSLKTAKLLNLLWRHIEAKTKEIRSYSQKEPLKKKIEFNSKDAFVYKALGEQYEERKFSEAEQAFKKFLKVTPNNYLVYVELGKIYRVQEKYPEAEAACRKAIELDPKNELAYMELGSVYKDQGLYSEAEGFYKKAIELNPGNDFIYLKLADMYKDQIKFIESEIYYKRAIELNPGNDSAYAGLGFVYVHQNKLSQAEDSFNKAIELNPKNDFAYEELGYLYLRQKKFSKMEDSYKKSVELNTNNVWGYAGLESICFERGDFELFKEYREKARRTSRREYKAVTITNYLKVKQILDKRTIRLVCVQYPMLNIEPLKRIFEGQKGVIFVDNEKTFKYAVENEGLKAYFKNMCNGEFGHCTDRGNKLLAENIADAILKEVFKK